MLTLEGVIDIAGTVVVVGLVQEQNGERHGNCLNSARVTLKALTKLGA